MQFFASFALLFLAAFAGLVSSYRITGPTTGINSDTGERPARQDIRTLESSGEAWDLYIQALQRFQATDQQDLLSWYQVAGIHGRPYREWDGVSGANQRGYCTHGSTLFPTWHRPYLSLYEQILWNHTQEIAQEYPEESRERYQSAADNFRIPFWDWASSAGLPGSLTSTQLTINTPMNRSSIDNPLFRYVFRPQVGGPDFPSGGLASNAESTTRNSDAQSLLEANAGSLRDRTYNLLTRQADYSPFSNNAFSDDRGNRFDSVESIHDTIHGAIGGFMGLVPYSAFDPVFFLHHANVDRLFAIWQAINPASFVGEQSNRLGTFTTDAGANENVGTLLTPFHSNDGTAMYDSDGVRNTRTFGYTVPEVSDWGVNAEQVSSDTRAAVERLYSPDNQATRRRRGSRRGPRQVEVNKRQESSSDSYGGSGSGASYIIPPGLRNATNPSIREWYANVRIDKFSLGESFYIHFFIGDVPSDPSEWVTGPESFTGTFVIFTDPGMANGADGVDIYGQIPLTRRLVQLYSQGVIADLEIDTMIEFLRKNLRWRAQRYDLSDVPLEGLDSLEIFVVQNIIASTDAAADIGAGGIRFNGTNSRVGGSGCGSISVGKLQAVPEITEGQVGGIEPDTEECD